MSKPLDDLKDTIYGTKEKQEVKNIWHY
jgi:hypothetical protein